MSNDDIQIFDQPKSHPDEELSRKYKESPSIENYLHLRNSNPNKEIEVAATGGLEWLFANEKLIKDQGIDPETVAAALDADHECISNLSLSLLQRLVDRHELKKSGSTQIVSRGNAISDALVNYLIAMMLDALSWNNELEIPRDLVVLTRHQLLGSRGSLFDKKIESKHTRSTAVSIAAQSLESGIPVSMRQIAGSLKKNVSTISRMFPDNSLEIEAERFLHSLRTLTGSKTPFADITAERKSDSE